MRRSSGAVERNLRGLQRPDQRQRRQSRHGAHPLRPHALRPHGTQVSSPMLCCCQWSVHQLYPTVNGQITTWNSGHKRHAAVSGQFTNCTQLSMVRSPHRTHQVSSPMSPSCQWSVVSIQFTNRTSCQWSVHHMELSNQSVN